jgi:hypothetical protein
VRSFSQLVNQGELLGEVLDADAAPSLALHHVNLATSRRKSCTQQRTNNRIEFL